MVDAGAAPARPLPAIPGFSDLLQIGRGGCSIVYAATQDAFGRRVALKVVDLDGDDARRCEREARALGRLSGIDHVVQVHQVLSASDGRPVLVMTLMPSSVDRVLNESGPVSPEIALTWLDQVGGALDAAHLAGVAHRDIKPGNLLLSARGEAFLADFGIAALDDQANTVSSLSVSPPHAPPERLMGAEAAPRSGDLYSLASTFYAVLTGSAPFGTAQDGGVFGLTQRVVGDEVPQRDLGPHTHEVFRRGLAKDPRLRFGTASEFAAALRSALKSDGTLTADRESVAIHSARSVIEAAIDADLTTVRPVGGSVQPGRRRRVPLVLVSAFLLCAVVAATAWAATRQADEETRGTPISSDGVHTCVAVAERLRCWGSDQEGQLGDGSSGGRGVQPVNVLDLGPVTSVTNGDNHTCAAGNGMLWCWGRNWAGQVGPGAGTQTATPIEVDLGRPVLLAAAGRQHTCAVTDDGAVWCWGRDDWGQAGGRGVVEPEPSAPDDVEKNRSIVREPARLTELPASAADLTAGDAFTCASLTDGTVWCWGSDQWGELGDGGTGGPAIGRGAPRPVVDIDDAVAVTAGTGHVCALRSDTSLACWGDNSTGQLGLDPAVSPVATSPAVVPGLTDVVRVSAGGSLVDREGTLGVIGHTCAVLEGGELQCWGDNSLGQLGDGTTQSSWRPRTVDVPRARAVAAGGAGKPKDATWLPQASTCVLTDGGDVWCWGSNRYGQLGNGTTEPSASPGEVQPS
jgi:alpha-tubulin suppressor-like RCC1 family protein